MSDIFDTSKTFSDLNLRDSVLRGIEDMGFKHPTDAQSKLLPPILEGKDVIGQAKTGTGKTAAFLVALFQHLLTHPAPASRTEAQPRALVLAPTRELAIQIDKDARLIGRYLDMKLRLIYGGTGYESQRRDLQEGVDVLIGTPGRIIDYLKQGIYSFDGLQVVVLDEADRMFDLGFISDIRYLFRRMPEPAERLSMLFSATLSLRVTELAFEHMNHPEHVQSHAEQVTADRVEQVLYHPANDEKIPLLIGLMKKLQPSRALVFVNTRRGTEWVSRNLEGNGIQAAVLSGEVPQKKRQRLLTDFQEGRLPVLIATDVAARGLHIPEVSHVFNFDLPQSGEDYVHRIGRTARAGESGHAVSFACEDTAFYVPEIEEYIETKLPTAAVTSDLLAETARPAPPQRRRQDGAGRKGGDRGKGGSRGGGQRDGGGDRKRRPRRKPSGTTETSS